jgi:1,2-phenylacetyl-CoA epoxidase PaaB subunit
MMEKTYAPNAWMRCDKNHKSGIRRADATSMWCVKCKKIVSVTPDFDIVVKVIRISAKVK